ASTPPARGCWTSCPATRGTTRLPSVAKTPQSRLTTTASTPPATPSSPPRRCGATSSPPPPEPLPLEARCAHPHRRPRHPGDGLMSLPDPGAEWPPRPYRPVLTRIAE